MRPGFLKKSVVRVAVAIKLIDGAGLTLARYLAGGCYTLRNHSRLQLFGQFLLGAAHTSGSLSPDQIGLGAAISFSMAAGGGLDVKLGPHIALRVVQADYLLTMPPNRTNRANQTNRTHDKQNNVRVGAGTVVYFGGH